MFPFFPPSIYHEVIGPDAMILVFWMLSFKPTFSLSSFTFIKRLFSSFSLPLGWCHLHIWGCWYFSWQSWFQLVLHPAQRFSWGTLLLLLLSCFSHVRLCATPWTAAYQASLSMGFSRQEHWSGLPFPSPVHESGKWKWSCSVVSDS